MVKGLKVDLDFMPRGPAIYITLKVYSKKGNNLNLNAIENTLALPEGLKGHKESYPKGHG